MPQAFNSVNTSVKNPGSALIRSMFPLRRFTIKRHLWREIFSLNLLLVLYVNICCKINLDITFDIYKKYSITLEPNTFIFYAFHVYHRASHMSKL